MVLGQLLQILQKKRTFLPETDELTGGQDLSAHGYDGPIAVSYGFNVSSFFKDYAIPTVEALGEVINEDNSDETPIGGTFQQLSVFPGTYNRPYSANSYLWPNQDRKNLHVFTDSLISRILWNDAEDDLATANGVEYITANGAEVLNAKNVILSAGALHSPKVLELSGVGDPAILESLSTETSRQIFAKPYTETELDVNVFYALKNDSVTIGSETNAPLIDLVPGQQVLSEEDLQISAQLRANKSDDLSDAQYAALQKFFEDGFAQTEINWSLVQQEDGSVKLDFYATDLHTYSRGYVHPNSSDPTAKVTIDPKYLSAEHDLWYLSRAVAYTRNITSTEPLGSIIDSEVTPGVNYSSPEDLQELLRPNFITM
ncbi:hypothetical protein D9758_011756 [Tetrapyrgos nigripes]|uniref:Glucose-methanol-choline oxidoreductase N-terminal domain-containing protein n=1 Tax=Tetrapyrgos nigripes TaxID=182062 RepID=A0A8H5FUL2_9AGAR|nr:hypothetical protein D9758_011756 [Tetrapyrgos nigripes]